MTPYEKFKLEGAQQISAQGLDADVTKASLDWVAKVNRHKYSYHFEWLGRPIIQYPQDIVAMQELIWRVKPDLIIETGIAHGGSLIFSASMLELNASCGGPTDATVLGIDIDIRTHNRKAVEDHPMSRRINMIQGSSIAPETIKQVQAIVESATRVLVCLDSNHTHDHVLAELIAYAPLTSIGSYCVVFDTVVEDLPPDSYPAGSWGKGNNPKTAVLEYLRTHSEFEIDLAMDNKLLVSVAPSGYLLRIR